MPAYPLSFTAAALLPRESVIVAEEYLTVNNWDATHQHIADRDLFGYGKPKTTQRIFKELSIRLQMLTENELELVASGNTETVRLLLWQACCRAYPFIGNFALRVLRPKLAAYDYTLREADFQRFLREEADAHPKLDRMAESTLRKLETRLYAMLREVGIAEPTEDHYKLRPLLVPELLCTCAAAPYLKYWLLSDAVMERYVYDRA